MAQPMQCDFSGCPNVVSLTGGYIVSEVLTGDTNAWCPEHYLLLCAAIVANAEQQDQPQAQPEATPPDEPTDEDEDQEAVLARLAAQQPSPQVIEGYANPDGSRQGNQAADVTPEPFPATTEVVKRGTSPGRRAHQARKAARSRKAAEPTTEASE